MAAPSPAADHRTAPPPSCRNQAWVAMGALAVFFGLYALLVAWLMRTGLRLFRSLAAGQEVFWTLVALGCVGFILVFLLKGLFGRAAKDEGVGLEVTAADQPRLVAFLHALADQVGAPRPWRIRLVPGVNACVYDHRGLLNLFLPRRKHLDIGLGLVARMNLGTFRAVCAHEFGHFAQSTTIMGRWAGICHQMAQRIVHKRDVLDGFLDGLARVDIRIAWIAWLLKLIVWALRSLVETALQLVMLAHRSLSRSMEYQADHVAGAVSGADALVFALHRLEAADADWSRTLAFMDEMAGQKRAVPDAYAVLEAMQGHMARILDQEGHGLDPAPGPDGRVFQAGLGQPPQMWATHPLNHEREQRLREAHPAVPVDPEPAWSLFDDPGSVRERMTQLLYKGIQDVTPAPVEEVLEALDRKQRREHLDARYRGIYRQWDCTRGVDRPSRLYGALDEPGLDLETLYPESLGAACRQLEAVRRDVAGLERILDGRDKPVDGVIRLQGRELSRPQAQEALQERKAECARLEETLAAHDQRVRTAHRAAAARVSTAWEAHLVGLAQVLFWAEHSAANLADVYGFLHTELRLASSMRGRSEKRFLRALAAAESAQSILEIVYSEAHRVTLDPRLQEALGEPSVPALLGALGIHRPCRENWRSWLEHVDGWFRHTGQTVRRIADAALDQLLEAEKAVQAAVREGAPLPEVPGTPGVTGELTPFPRGRERVLETRLQGLDRILASEGVLTQGLRLVTASVILFGVHAAARELSISQLTVCNDLGRPVRVSVEGRDIELAPHAHETLPVSQTDALDLDARTFDGTVIERFQARVEGGHYVYNVASAGVMLEWTATYGSGEGAPPRCLGNPRFFQTSARDVLSAPPSQIRSGQGGGSRLVLESLAQDDPAHVAGRLERPEEAANLIRAHARWDALQAPGTSQWLVFAARTPGGPEVLRLRQKEAPNAVELLRALQETEPDPARRRAMVEAQVAQGGLPEADATYLRIRALPEGEAQDQAFLEAQARFPEHPWLAYVAGTQALRAQRWTEASRLWTVAARHPGLSQAIADDRLRLEHYLHGGSAPDPSRPVPSSLVPLVAVERGNPEKLKALEPWTALSEGRIEDALRLVHGTPEEARMLRLVAASRFATPAMIQAALKLKPREGMDAITLPYAYALALREKADTAGLAPLFATFHGPQGEGMRRFLDKAASGQVAEAPKALGVMNALPLGLCHAAGVVLLGDKAPEDWRAMAVGFTFSAERPCLRSERPRASLGITFVTPPRRAAKR